jgi:copper chaperone CopZ
MHTFIVNDLICEACSGAITDTIRYADPQAKVQIDLETFQVEIDSQLSREELALRLMEAGYTPEPF